MNKKILFIEDEPEIVMMMKIRLEASNYAMLSAYDGKEGLAKARQELPDLILLDVVMPKINGLVICRRIKDDPKIKDIPIIVVSASGGADLPQRCKAAGADDLIMKPFDAKELLDKIEGFIG